MEAFPMGAPEMLRNDEVQGAADRFIGGITKKSSSALVPNPNRSLPIREDDRIRRLFHKQTEKLLIQLHHSLDFPTDGERSEKSVSSL